MPVELNCDEYFVLAFGYCFSRFGFRKDFIIILYTYCFLLAITIVSVSILPFILIERLNLHLFKLCLLNYVHNALNSYSKLIHHSFSFRYSYFLHFVEHSQLVFDVH